MRMVNISNEKSMQSYTARCSRYKNKYTNLVCGKTAVGRNYNLPRDRQILEKTVFILSAWIALELMKQSGIFLRYVVNAYFPKSALKGGNNFDFTRRI